MRRKHQSEPPLRIGLVALGCAKNLVDAEVMLGSLAQAGAEITNDPSQADVLIVNTCAFIEAAQEESVDAILEAAQARDRRHSRQALVVAGCLPQRFRGDLPALLPEVDAFMGIDQVTQVGEIVRRALAGRSEKLRKGPAADGQRRREASRLAARRSRFEPAGLTTALERVDRRETTGILDVTKPGTAQAAVVPAPGDGGVPRAAVGPVVEVNARPSYLPDHSTPRLRLTPRHSAFVKIAEGCNHPCSFCVIPRMRGGHRSRPLRDVVDECRQLVADGVRELNLISQDTTYYGLDLRPKRRGAIASPERFVAAARALPADTPTLCTLVRELNAIPGDFWIRLLYTHPAHWTDELIETMADCSKVARYVDLPLQHIHPVMLERMRRETSDRHLIELLRRIRAGVPGIALRTTFIVGFPGETEAYFERLIEFIREMRFERLGVFTYSNEAGTRAAAMSGQVPDRVKQRRRDRAMAEQGEIARAMSAANLGRTLKVLVEKQASADDLEQADVSSWEHGLIRNRRVPDPDFGTQGGWLARGEADAPDIDGRVYVRGECPPGEFARVKVIGHTTYDLIAEPCA